MSETNNIIIAENTIFRFGSFTTTVHTGTILPAIGKIAGDFGGGYFRPLIVCDANTRPLAEKITGGEKIPVCVLEAGEQYKTWDAVETILRRAHDEGIGRDGTIVGVGGGVVCDLAAFAASVFMRGCSLALIPTTLLAMADAGLGGKTGFDYFGVKNFAGTFYPAAHVYLCRESLQSLPLTEWKSGMAEVIKTAVLSGGNFLNELVPLAAVFSGSGCSAGSPLSGTAVDTLLKHAVRAALYKGGIVEEDPRETGQRRMLLNLGHTFGHALESSAGLGTITHGEAVAWGMVRSCELGLSLGICPPERARKISSLLNTFGYTTAAPHPLLNNTDTFIRALYSDKKKRGGKLTFIVPDEESARPVICNTESMTETVQNIINGVNPS